MNIYLIIEIYINCLLYMQLHIQTKNVWHNLHHQRIAGFSGWHNRYTYQYVFFYNINNIVINRDY